MMVMSAIAGVVNYLCLRLLQRLKDPDVNLRAATTFSFNDFISNGGILIAGVLVLWLGTNWPDLLVGFATAIIAIKGGVEILRDARAETRSEEHTSELQSLMRISYAVFCLKKKKNTKNTHLTYHNSRY